MAISALDMAGSTRPGGFVTTPPQFSSWEAMGGEVRAGGRRGRSRKIFRRGFSLLKFRHAVSKCLVESLAFGVARSQT